MILCSFLHGTDVILIKMRSFEVLWFHGWVICTLPYVGEVLNIFIVEFVINIHKIIIC